MFTSHVTIHAEAHAATRRRELLAEAERDRLAAASVRPRSVAGALSAAVARVPTLRPRRAGTAAPASGSAAAA